MDTIGRELREVRERWPATADRPTRAIVADWILAMRRVDLAAERGQWQEAAIHLDEWRRLVAVGAPLVAAAEPRSLYAADSRSAYLAARDRLSALATHRLD